MQNKNIAVSGVTAVVAPCPAAAFDLVSATTFNFVYADSVDSALQVGDAAPAVQLATGSFVFKAIAPDGSHFFAGQTVGYITSGTGPVYACPSHSRAV